MSILNFKNQTTSPVGVRSQSSARSRSGLPKLFAAAVINVEFCETLLHRPEEALEQGYLGELFSLTDSERFAIQSVRADTLTDLARKVNRALKDI